MQSDGIRHQALGTRNYRNHFLPPDQQQYFSFILALGSLQRNKDWCPNSMLCAGVRLSNLLQHWFAPPLYESSELWLVSMGNMCVCLHSTVEVDGSTMAAWLLVMAR